MEYKEILESVNPATVLDKLGMRYHQEGRCLKFQCQCGGLMVINAYGDKKNLTYCPKCHKSGHVIGLVLEKNGWDKDDPAKWEESKKWLRKNATGYGKLITEELELGYELTAEHAAIQSQGIDILHATSFGVGVPKGKSILSGHVAFIVHNESGTKVAYVGQSLSEGKFKAFRTFDPEMYLYRYNFIRPEDDEVYFASSLFECLRIWQENKRAVSNFGLPYLSDYQAGLLNGLNKPVTFRVHPDYQKWIAYQASKKLTCFYRFETEPEKEEQEQQSA